MTTLRSKTFWEQLKKRKVVRVALAYIFVAWIVMQIGEVTFEGLGLPPWSLSLLIVLVLLGFPIALVMAWAYEVTPEVSARIPPATWNPSRKLKLTWRVHPRLLLCLSMT